MKMQFLIFFILFSMNLGTTKLNQLRKALKSFHIWYFQGKKNQAIFCLVKDNFYLYRHYDSELSVFPLEDAAV